MSRMVCIVLIAVLMLPCISQADTIDVHIKGVDDGVKTTKQLDYKEAVLFAKREAIKRAGVKIKLMTTVKDMVLNSDYIESQAEAVLLPGYDILDMGYSADGTYQVVLIGKVKITSEGLDSKELRYAQNLMERGEDAKARKIITDIINNSKDDNAVAEAMYCEVLWKLTSDERDSFEKIKAYYPNSKYIGPLKTLLAEREAAREAARGRELGRDGRFIAYDKGTVKDTKTGLMWAAKDNGSDITWDNAKAYCENHSGGGYTDWRMPTQDELAEIYDSEKRNRHGYKVTELIDITAFWVWASEVQYNSALHFNFNYGDRDESWRSCFKDCRALPVRGGK